MSSANVVENYGWADSMTAHSSDYVSPAVLDALADLNAQRVVDIGAGNGILCGAMAGAGFSTYGIEYDAGGVAVATQTHPTIRFYQRGVQDDASDIVAAEGLVDAAVSTEVVEHLFSPQLLPTFARQLIRPKGHLIITTPYHGYLKNLALSLTNKWDDHHTALWHGGHIKFWSRQTLTKLLNDNGFSVVGFRGVGRIRWAWKSMVLVAQAD